MNTPQKFDGTNTRVCLLRYEALTHFRQFQEKEKTYEFLQHVDDCKVIEVASLASWRAGDWDLFAAELLDKFPDKQLAPVYHTADLSNLVRDVKKQGRPKTFGDIMKFHKSFNPIAKYCLDRGKITQALESEIFLEALDPDVLNQLEQQAQARTMMDQWARHMGLTKDTTSGTDSPRQTKQSVFDLATRASDFGLPKMAAPEHPTVEQILNDIEQLFDATKSKFTGLTRSIMAELRDESSHNPHVEHKSPVFLGGSSDTRSKTSSFRSSEGSTETQQESPSDSSSSSGGLNGINNRMQQMKVGSNPVQQGAHPQISGAPRSPVAGQFRSASPMQPRPYDTGANAIPVNNSGSTPAQQAPLPGALRPVSCIYCRATDHAKARCGLLNEHLRMGLVKIDDNTRFVLLATTNEQVPVRPAGESSMYHWVERQREKTGGRTAENTGTSNNSGNKPSVNSVSFDVPETAPQLRVPDMEPFVGYIEVEHLSGPENDDRHASMEPEPSSSDTEIDDMFDTLTMDAMATKRAYVEDGDDEEEPQPRKRRDLRREPHIPIQQPWKQPIGPTLQVRPQPAPRTPPQQVVNPPKATPQSEKIKGKERQRRPQDDDDDIEMMGSTQGAASRQQKTGKMQAPVASDINKVIEKAYAKILGQEITLPARDLIAISPTLQDMLKEDCSRRRVPVERVTQAKVSVIDGLSYEANEAWFQVPLETPIYAGSLAFAEGKINGTTARMLVDSGAMVSVMSDRIRQKLKLPLRVDGKHVIRGINGTPEMLKGISENVMVNIGGINTPVHFFVHSNPNHEIILGQAFLMHSAASVDYDVEGAVVMTLRGPNGKVVSMEVTSKTAHYMVNVDGDPEDVDVNSAQIIELEEFQEQESIQEDRGEHQWKQDIETQQAQGKDSRCI